MQLERVIGITAAEWESLRAQAAAFLPQLGAALLMLVAGWALASLLRFVVRRAVAIFDRALPALRVRTSLQRLGLERPAGDILGAVVFWLVLLVFVSSALDSLGLPVLSVWVEAVARYLPRILSALLIGLAGVIAGVLVRDAISAATLRAGLSHGALVGRLLQMTILGVSALVAVDQVGLNVTLVSQFLLALLGATFFSAAIAFGLGARVIVANILACHYLRRTFSVGHRVQVGGHEGEIDHITPTAVVLSTPEGRVVVPARLFVEEVIRIVR